MYITTQCIQHIHTLPTATSSYVASSGMKALSFSRAKIISTALAVLIFVNVFVIIGYVVSVRSTGLTNHRSSKMESWTSYSVLEPMEREILIQKLGQGKEVKKKQSLVEDMMQCSLAMGMTRKELKRNMLNLTIVATKAQLFLTVLQSIIPANFSQDMKNPCWYSNLTLGSSLRAALLFGLRGAKQLFKLATGLFHMSGGSTELYCLPYFFIAGFPKSGTTTLHEALQQHPQIARPTGKEPHWWTRVSLEDMNTDYLKLTVLEYLFYFIGAAKKISQYPKEGMITYDGSQSTLWDSNFYLDNEDYCAMPAIISRILPNANFIVLMRNPVTREYSNYFYSCGPDTKTWPKRIQEDPAGQFHKAVETDTTVFTNCLKTTNNSIHECVRQIRFIRNGCRTGHIGKRLPISLYYVHLLKWMQFYPRENFLFLRTEDMRQQPHRMMNHITNFLKVDPVSKEQAREWLRREANAQTIYSTDSEKFKMKPETKQLLEEFYRPFNAKLVELTDSKRFLWVTKQ